MNDGVLSISLCTDVSLPGFCFLGQRESVHRLPVNLALSFESMIEILRPLRPFKCNVNLVFFIKLAVLTFESMAKILW